MAAAPALWAFYEPHPSSWVLMGPHESSQLEAAFADPGCTELELSCGAERQFRVDLMRMEQTSVQTGFRRAISRQCAPSAAAVWEWQENDGSWKAYEPNAAGQLGAAQAAGRRTTTIFVLSRHRANPYCVEWLGGADGGDGRQRNVATRVVRPVRWGAAAAASGLVAATAATGAAASGCPSFATLHFRAGAQPLDTTQLAGLTGWSVLRPGEWEEGADDPIMFSPLGEDGEAVVRLPCHSAAISCTFNLSTIEQALRLSPHCPTCTQAYALPGVQPSGSMQTSTERLSCDGHDGCATLVLQYDFPSGVQGPRDPTPGVPYRGTRRTCYYPHSPLGWSCVSLLRLAFERGQLFRIGASATTGHDNVVVWAGIHQKTAMDGGATNHGWPDDTCLQRLQSEAASKGVVLPSGTT
eukprot:scaffold27785_cov81-Phaeocystis_antarctica.AAC.2